MMPKLVGWTIISSFLMQPVNKKQQAMVNKAKRFNQLSPVKSNGIFSLYTTLVNFGR